MLEINCLRLNEIIQQTKQKQKQKQSNLGNISRLHPYLALANTHFHKELQEKK